MTVAPGEETVRGTEPGLQAFSGAFLSATSTTPPGVIDVKAFEAETAEDVAARIRLLLQYVAPDTKEGLRALVEGARVVRKESEG